MNPNASSSTPSDGGRDELEALAKDGELLPRSLDLTVTQVLYRSLPGALESATDVPAQTAADCRPEQNGYVLGKEHSKITREPNANTKQDNHGNH